MTIHAIANAAAPSATDTLGSLQMSAPRAREFLTDLRNGRSPIIATGDEGGTVQINYAVTTAGAVFSVHRPGERQAVCQCAVDPTCDMGFTCDELLADLGA
jgi:hypothetical protein